MYVYPESDHLPGEPIRVRQPTRRFAWRVLGRGLLVAPLGVIAVALYPLFVLGIAI